MTLTSLTGHDRVTTRMILGSKHRISNGGKTPLLLGHSQHRRGSRGREAHVLRDYCDAREEPGRGKLQA